MDHFPKTAAAFLSTQDTADPYPLLMELYWEPLQIYYWGSSFHPGLGEAKDVVHGFLAWYSEHQYLQGWRAGEQRLRYYLINGFKKFLMQERDRLIRSRRMQPLPEQLPAADSEACEFDRSYVRGILQQALKRGQQKCADRGLEPHWRIFVRHTFDGRKFREIAEEFDLGVSRAEVMCKAGRRRFREAFWELLARQGIIPTQFQAEVDLYLEILEA